MTRHIMNESEFTAQLSLGNGVFRDVQFTFPVVLHKRYDFEIRFENCRFIGEVSITQAHFNDKFALVNCYVDQGFNASFAVFHKFAYIRDNVFRERADFRKTCFLSNVNFFGSVFEGEAFFDHTCFSNETSFYRVQFLNNVYFHKTYMGIRADFSYASFSHEHTISFFSLSNTYKRDDGTQTEYQPPIFIFRYILFPKKTLFTNVDLSHTLFQDSYIIPIVFKNCIFSHIDGRNCFYQEIAQHVFMRTNKDMFAPIAEGQDFLSLRIDDEVRKKLQIGDMVTFVNSSNTSQTYKVFITWIYRGDSVDDLFSTLAERMPEMNFQAYRKRLETYYTQEQLEENGLMGFSFKHFDERRHWENLEDINRQMKRSLEESRDWQKAGAFYVGEMHSMIKRLEERKQSVVYRNALRIYGFMTGFCESIPRILMHMVFSFTVSMVVLDIFTHSQLSFMHILEYNLSFFIPVLGGKSVSLQSLHLLPWQNTIMMLQIVWYYLLWFLLALTLQRKFRR